MKHCARILFSLLLVVSHSVIFGQSVEMLLKESADSLSKNLLGNKTEEIIAKAISETKPGTILHARAILQKGKLYNFRYAFKEVISTLKPNAKNAVTDSLKAQYYILIGHAYGFSGETDSSLHYLDLSFDILKELNDGSGLINLHINKGFTFFRALKEDLAFKEYQEAMQLMEEYRDSSKFVPVMSNAAACLVRLGDYESAKVYYKKLLENYSKEESFVGQVYTNLGVVYLGQDSALKAEGYFLTAIPLLQTSENTNFLGTTYFNLIDVCIKKGEFERALTYADLAEPIFKKAQPSRLGFLYAGYANVYKELGQEEKALSYYLRALDYAEQFEEWEEAAETARNLSNYYEGKNQFKEALVYSKKHADYRDRFLEETKLQAIEKSRIAFETGQKEKQIEQLKELSQAKSDRIDAQKKVQNFIIGISIGLVVIGIFITFLVMRFRLQRIELSNKVGLAELNNKLVLNRLSPHFIFNVLNSIQYYINTNDRKNANYYLAKFADLLRKFLETFSAEHHTIEDELALINEYVALEQMLKNNSFSYTISVDEDIEKSMTFPTMLLQPLVENAIKHGTTNTNPYVKVVLENKADAVICIIEDNGTGLQTRNERHRSRGIELCEKRIELLNHALNSKYELSWANKTRDETGLKITLKIPKQQ